jgi:hypothetical protein
MNPLALKAIAQFIGGVFKALPFIGAYIAGQKSASAKMTKAQYKRKLKDEDNKERNKRLSDATIFNKLYKSSRRKDRK